MAEWGCLAYGRIVRIIISRVAEFLIGRHYVFYKVNRWFNPI